MSRYLLIGVIALFGECISHKSFDLKILWSKKTQNLDQTTTSQCFEFYTPQLGNAAEEWSNSYNDCINKADSDRDTFMTQIEEDRSNIVLSSNEVVSYINSCQAAENDVDFFNCFGGLNQNVLGTIFTISNKAMIDAALLNQQLNGIDASLYLCTNATEYAYVEQVAAINNGLTDCLKHGLPVDENNADKGGVLIGDGQEKITLALENYNISG